MRTARTLACLAALVVVAATTDAVADPAATTSADGSVVLVATVAAGTSVAGVAERADAGPADVQHVLTPLRRVSVEVPADDAQAQASRIDALPGVTSVTQAARRYVSAVPNDPSYTLQQAYLAAVDAPAAWDVTHGSSTVKIGIVDTGIDVGHPDLKGKIIGTYNAHTGGTSVPDAVGHGTFVAGVAAAATDNGVGVAGAGYDSSLLIAKVDEVDPTDQDGYTITTDDEAAGITWLANNGAKIINISLGAPGSDQTEQAAVQYAQSKGALIVAAAGNEASSTRSYPAAYPGVLAVGATDAAGHRASFSNYGSWVDLAAPGTNIYSTTVRSGSAFWPGAGAYDSGDGTSFSSPLVAGAAALLAAVEPNATAAQLSSALVSTAHGYAGLQLGAGQVDLDAAVASMVPKTVPALAGPSGSSGTVPLSATSTSAYVRFAVDGSPVALAAVSGGTATISFATYGYADGTHQVTAANCTSAGYCGPSSNPSSLTIDNVDPTLTSPAAGVRADGDLTLVADAPGGGVAFYADGVRVGFAASAPYSFVLSRGTLANGRHAITARSCTSSGTVCAGPVSAATPVTIAWVHPTITAVSPSAFSPNGDGVKDTATVTYSLGEPARVSVDVRDAAGDIVAGPFDQGAVATSSTWTWSGAGTTGTAVPDGSYSITVTAVATIDGAPATGSVSSTVTVDTTPPSLSSASGAGTTFYPYRDGYADTFGPSAVLGDAATLSLVVRSSTGVVVRTLTAARGAGRSGFTWNGTDDAGRAVPAGTYTYLFVAVDGTGNRTVTPASGVTVSSKRLVTVSRTLTRRGSEASRHVRDATCERVVRSERGRRLINSCVPGARRTVQAAYQFTLPAAVSYTSLTTSVRGRAAARPGRVTARTVRVRGGSTAGGARTVRSATLRTYSLGRVPAAGLVSAKRVAQVLVGLTNRYTRRGEPAEFDIRSVSVRVTYRVLR